MDNMIIKVEKKVIVLPLILLIFISIFFLVFLIISIIHNLMGYYVYFILIVPFMFIRLYLEIKWLTDVEIIFTKDKLILNVFDIKKATEKHGEYFYRFWRPFIVCSRSNGLTRYAVLKKIELNYHDITNCEIIKDRDLEIIAEDKKYLVMGSFFHYQGITNKWKSVYKQFSKEQIQFIYEELKKRINSRNEANL
jgi:hypothetical protein